MPRAQMVHINAGEGRVKRLLGVRWTHIHSREMETERSGQPLATVDAIRANLSAFVNAFLMQTYGIWENCR